MKKQTNSKMFKSLVAAAIIIAGGSVHADTDGKCGACNAQKVIAEAQSQGISELDSISYSLGNWKVEGKDKDGNELTAKIHCPQAKGSKASLVKIGDAKRISMNEIVKKVGKLTSGKIQNIQFNGVYWNAVVIEDSVELEYHFDKTGALKGQLAVD